MFIWVNSNMTQQLTNLQIDTALAKVIGYLPEHIRTDKDVTSVYRPKTDIELNSSPLFYQVFSHQDPTMILPIIEEYAAEDHE